MTDFVTEDLLRSVRKRTAVRLWKVLPVEPDRRGAEIENFMNPVTSSTALGKILSDPDDPDSEVLLAGAFRAARTLSWAFVYPGRSSAVGARRTPWKRTT